MLIGDKLHQLRKLKKMTLTELSEKSGVQMATLSRIQNKKMTGTLESHIAIAKALGIDIVELYRDIEKEMASIEFGEAQKRMDMFTHSDQSSFDILTKNVLYKKMMPVLIHIKEGGKTNSEQSPGGSEKFIFVLEGKVEVRVGDKSFQLGKQHTLYFDSALSHYFVNIGKNAARILCVGTPVSL